jgi:hypothetical protein
MTELSTKGVVTAIAPRSVQTQRGAATVTDITVNGIKISTFRPGDVKVGDTIDARYSQNGNFFNAVSIVKLTPPVQSTLAMEENILPAPASNAPKPLTMARVDINAAIARAIEYNAGKDVPLSKIEADAVEILRMSVRMYNQSQ